MAEKLVLVGAGPGNYTAAILAAEAGLDTYLIDKEAVGGTCLQWGCIPSKILLDEAKFVRDARKRFGSPRYDNSTLTLHYDALIDHSRQEVDRITRSLAGLLQSKGVNLIQGEARFSGPKTLTVNNETLTAEKILIGVGARPNTLDFPDHPRVLTSRTALALREQPKKIVIIGAGAVGCEFASFWHGIGVEVVLTEGVFPRIVPAEDEEISQTLAKSFTKQGITIVTGAFIDHTRSEFHDDLVVLALTPNPKVRESIPEKLTVIEASHVLIAAGIVPATDTLGLASAGVACDNRGFIQVNLPSYETNIPGIYAIGDVIALPDGKPYLAHVAAAEAENAVEAMLGKRPKPIEYHQVTRGTFTYPEVASVGYTEAQARAMGCAHPHHHETETGQAEYRVLGRNIALGATEGFAKIVRGCFDGIAGAHIIGDRATDIIDSLAAEMWAEDTISHANRRVVAHPTAPEIIAEALRVFDGRAVHMPRRKKS